MYYLLIPTHVAAVVAWVYFVKWEAHENYRLIQADGSKDTLRQGFHASRTLIRLTVGLPLAVAASLPLWGDNTAMAAGAFGLLVLFGGIFLRWFNPMLSSLRGLPVAYVSLAPNASAFDRFVLWLTRHLHQAILLPDDLGSTFWLVLNACLLGSLVVYTALTLWAVW